MTLLITLGAVLFGTGLWLWMLRAYDRVEPEEVRYLVVVAVLGGGLSVTIAALLNESARSALGVYVDVIQNPGDVGHLRLALLTLAVGTFEEICKAVAAVVTTRLLADLNEPIDAMIYAMTVALGFAAIENVIYAARFGNEVLLVRFLWPVPAHMAYAAVWGYGWARWRFITPDLNAVRVMAPYVLAAGLVHAGANYLLFQQGTLTMLLSLAALAALAYLAHDRLLQLEAESPFLRPGECHACRHMNPPHESICRACGAELTHTHMFRTCPCGLTRIPVRMADCPVCGVSVAAEDEARASRRSPTTTLDGGTP